MSATAPVRSLQTAVLPFRDGDPDSPLPTGLSPTGPAAEILRWAEALGIPWRRILLAEIESEQRLRRYVADVQNELPLASAMTILSFSFLRSWRVRDQFESLACRARGASDRTAIRQLRLAFQSLTGRSDRDQVAFAQHLHFAYQRVLLLQRVSRAAARSRGTMPERLAFVCSTTRCCFEDAAWAVCQEGSPKRGYRLEAAVRKVREEGFLIPRAETEARSLAMLRRIARTSPASCRRPRDWRRAPGSLAAPQRVPLPVDAI